jgi:hypothetical protein
MFCWDAKWDEWSAGLRRHRLALNLHIADWHYCTLSYPLNSSFKTKILRSCSRQGILLIFGFTCYCDSYRGECNPGDQSTGVCTTRSRPGSGPTVQVMQPMIGIPWASAGVIRESGG